MRTIRNIGDWEAPTSGLYRYVVSDNAAYELVIEKAGIHEGLYDVESAIASVCMAGEWKAGNGTASWYGRVWILRDRPLQECLQAAYDDYKSIIYFS